MIPYVITLKAKSKSSVRVIPLMVNCWLPCCCQSVCLAGYSLGLSWWHCKLLLLCLCPQVLARDQFLPSSACRSEIPSAKLAFPAVAMVDLCSPASSSLPCMPEIAALSSYEDFQSVLTLGGVVPPSVTISPCSAELPCRHDRVVQTGLHMFAMHANCTLRGREGIELGANLFCKGTSC